MITKLKYTFQAFQKDQFWLPTAIMALFGIITVFIPESNKFNTARAFLGFTLPLIAGGLSAYAFLADTALELQFTTRRPAWKMIFERLGIILVVVLLNSLAFQVIMELMGISLSPLGGLLVRQLVWFVPCFTLMVLGGAASLLARNTNGGFALVGGLWILQLVLRGWFAQKPGWRNILLFLGVMGAPEDMLVTNQITLMTISLLLLAAAYYLLKKQERYI